MNWTGTGRISTPVLLLPFNTNFWVGLDPDRFADFPADTESSFVCFYNACLWFELLGIAAVSIIVAESLKLQQLKHKAHRVLSLSQFRTSSSSRRLQCFKQWGFQQFPASLLDRATDPLSGNSFPLVFNSKFLFASSFLCQFPLWSALSKSFNIYIFKIIRRN